MMKNDLPDQTAYLFPIDANPVEMPRIRTLVKLLVENKSMTQSCLVDLIHSWGNSIRLAERAKGQECATRLVTALLFASDVAPEHSDSCGPAEPVVAPRIDPVALAALVEQFVHLPYHYSFAALEQFISRWAQKLLSRAMSSHSQNQDAPDAAERPQGSGYHYDSDVPETIDRLAAKARFGTIQGTVIQAGNLDEPGVCGLAIRRPNGDVVTIRGVTATEMEAAVDLLFAPMVITPYPAAA
jgi:hypothetical protein